VIVLTGYAHRPVSYGLAMTSADLAEILAYFQLRCQPVGRGGLTETWRLSPHGLFSVYVHCNRHI